jgi:hypothetical protein
MRSEATKLVIIIGPPGALAKRIHSGHSRKAAWAGHTVDVALSRADFARCRSFRPNVPVLYTSGKLIVAAQH